MITEWSSLNYHDKSTWSSVASVDIYTHADDYIVSTSCSFWWTIINVEFLEQSCWKCARNHDDWIDGWLWTICYYMLLFFSPGCCLVGKLGNCVLTCCFSHIEKTTQQLYYSNLVHEHWCFKVEQTYHVPVQKTPPLKFPNKHLLRWVWLNISQHWILRKDQLLASSQHLPLAGTRYGLPWCP